MAENIFIGFRREPKNLEAVLRREGYNHKENYGNFIWYTREKEEWPQLILCDPNPIQIKAKFWDVLGIKVTSELAINYRLLDGTDKEAERLYKIIKKELSCFIYDQDFKKV